MKSVHMTFDLLVPIKLCLRAAFLSKTAGFIQYIACYVLLCRIFQLCLHGGSEIGIPDSTPLKGPACDLPPHFRRETSRRCNQ